MTRAHAETPAKTASQRDTGFTKRDSVPPITPAQDRETGFTTVDQGSNDLAASKRSCNRLEKLIREVEERNPFVLVQETRTRVIETCKSRAESKSKGVALASSRQDKSAGMEKAKRVTNSTLLPHRVLSLRTTKPAEALRLPTAIPSNVAPRAAVVISPAAKCLSRPVVPPNPKTNVLRNLSAPKRSYKKRKLSWPI